MPQFPVPRRGPAWCSLFAIFLSASPVGAQEIEETAPEAVEPEPELEPSAPLGETEEEALEQLDLAGLLELTVESASLQKEPLREAPVPVTVITSEMIRAIGARTLRDVLVNYVPGMTLVVDHNEYNVAMRGIYASSQQKILIMVDGRRLNQRAYLAAAPGFGISINPDKVAQIEVLRGPGSSVYGNAALTAVVNIITKAGSATDGLSMRVGGGDHGQIKGEMTYGKQLGRNHDLVVYGSAYRARGEPYNIAAADHLVGNLTTEVPTGGTAYIEGVKLPANYDVGLRYRNKDLSLVAQSRFDKLTESFSSGGRTGDIYNQSALRTFQGVGPGLGMRSTNLAAGWSHVFDSTLTLSADLGYDHSSVEGLLASNATNSIFLNWVEDAFYGIIQARYDYQIPGVGSGNVLLGVHLDTTELLDSDLPAGTDGELLVFNDRNRSRVLLQGRESSYSAFVQVKQRISDFAIANVGGRFDYKTRRNNDQFPLVEPPEVDDVSVFSPRASVIITPTSSFDIKLTYADAFVDSPYWYRYNSLPTYAGAFDLRPEKLRSFQVTPTMRFLDNALTTSVNFSFNGLRDGIYRVPDAVVGSGTPFYNNAGRLDSTTLEGEITFLGDWYRVWANYTWFQVVSVEEYTAFDPDSQRAVVNQGQTNGRVWNVPMFYGNLTLDLNPVKPFAPTSFLSNTWINLRLQHIGSRQSPIQRVSTNRPDALANLQNVEPDVVLVHTGLRLRDVYFQGLGFSVNVYNLLDQRWHQGGSTSFPYPQAGRWFLGLLEFQADL